MIIDGVAIRARGAGPRPAPAPSTRDYERIRAIARALEDSGAMKDAETLLALAREVRRRRRNEQEHRRRVKLLRAKVKELIARVEAVLREDDMLRARRTG